MTWELDSDRPIYKQLIEHFQLSIVSGCYKPGDKLPSVRDLAAEAAVNPNTMQKALADLEQAGLVYTQRTSGRYITEDKSMVEQLKNNLAIEQIKEFLEKMSRLGYTKQETVALMTSVKEENVQ